MMFTEEDWCRSTRFKAMQVVEKAQYALAASGARRRVGCKPARAETRIAGLGSRQPSAEGGTPQT